MFSLEFRGAKVTDEEKKRLNKLGGNILRETGLDFEEWKDHDWLKKDSGGVNGYAGWYLRKCVSKKTNEADATVYQRLVDIDTKLGTEFSVQLYLCLLWTTRWDIIKVSDFYFY